MKSSLERRLRRALLAFGAALAITYLIVVPQVAFKTEDAVLLKLAALQVERLREDPAAVLPEPMMRLSDRADLLDALRIRLLALPAGVHELNDVALTAAGPETDLVVGVAREGDPALIALQDVAELEAFDERIDAPGYYALVLIGAALSLVLAVSGSLITRRVFRSLRSLGQLITTGDLDRARVMLDRFDDDEIGGLAHRHVETRGALDRALLRERNFTRDASHELRTPVTVAAGAVELLERELGDSPRTAALLARLRSAHSRIEELIVVFLWLARHDRPEGEVLREPARVVVARVVQTLEQQEGRPLHGLQITEIGPHEVVHVPPLADIVVRNLLHNALRHGVGGVIKVEIAPDAIVIENPEPSDDEPSTRDHGFGQSIVDDLCRRFGWNVTFERRAGRYSARLTTRSTKS